MAVKLLLLALAAGLASLPEAAARQANRPVLAVFAHPDDEQIVAPLLSRLAREGREVHLVFATDGSRGVRDHAGIPAGSQLAAARAKEAECATKRLGVRQLHMIGMEDGALGASMLSLEELRIKLSAIIARVQPRVIITFGPEGLTGHPDHRLISDVTTEIVQSDESHRLIDLFYASLPAKRMRSAPPSFPRASGIADDLLTVQLPVEQQDIVAASESLACHRTQYTVAEMKARNRTLVYVWNGVVYLRPWNGPLRDPAGPFRR